MSKLNLQEKPKRLEKILQRKVLRILGNLARDLQLASKVQVVDICVGMKINHNTICNFKSGCDSRISTAFKNFYFPLNLLGYRVEGERCAQQIKKIVENKKCGVLLDVEEKDLPNFPVHTHVILKEK